MQINRELRITCVVYVIRATVVGQNMALTRAIPCSVYEVNISFITQGKWAERQARREERRQVGR